MKFIFVGDPLIKLVGLFKLNISLTKEIEINCKSDGNLKVVIYHNSEKITKIDQPSWEQYRYYKKTYVVY